MVVVLVVVVVEASGRELSENKREEKTRSDAPQSTEEGSVPVTGIGRCTAPALTESSPIKEGEEEGKEIFPLLDGSVREEVDTLRGEGGGERRLPCMVISVLLFSSRTALVRVMVGWNGTENATGEENENNLP